MFTSFVDSKILSQWQKPDENIVLFDQKLVELREKLGVLNTTRTPIIDKPPEFMFSGNFCHKIRDGQSGPTKILVLVKFWSMLNLSHQNSAYNFGFEFWQNFSLSDLHMKFRFMLF